MREWWGEPPGSPPFGRSHRVHPSHPVPPGVAVRFAAASVGRASRLAAVLSELRRAPSRTVAAPPPCCAGRLRLPGRSPPMMKAVEAAPQRPSSRSGLKGRTSPRVDAAHVNGPAGGMPALQPMRVSRRYERRRRTRCRSSLSSSFQDEGVPSGVRSQGCARRVRRAEPGPSKPSPSGTTANGPHAENRNSGGVAVHPSTLPSSIPSDPWRTARGVRRAFRPEGPR